MRKYIAIHEKFNNYKAFWEALKFQNTGDLDKIKRMVADGADINAQDNFDWTPLIHATHRNHINAVLYLLNRGANINKVGENNWTALHYAVNEGLTDMVEILLKHGADVELEDNDGKKAMDLATDIEIKQMIIRYMKSDEDEI